MILKWGVQYQTVLRCNILCGKLSLDKTHICLKVGNLGTHMAPLRNIYIMHIIHVGVLNYWFAETER